MSHSYRLCSTRVALVSFVQHSCRTCVALVLLVSHSCRILLARVWCSCCKLGQIFIGSFLVNLNVFYFNQIFLYLLLQSKYCLFLSKKVKFRFCILTFKISGPITDRLSLHYVMFNPKNLCPGVILTAAASTGVAPYLSAVLPSWQGEYHPG